MGCWVILGLSVLYFSLSSVILAAADNGDYAVPIPTTLDGPFKPVTVPLDQTFRGNAMDLPHTDPLLQTTAQDFQPQQISLSLSASHHSVSISWITGTTPQGIHINPPVTFHVFFLLSRDPFTFISINLCLFSSFYFLQKQLINAIFWSVILHILYLFRDKLNLYTFNNLYMYELESLCVTSTKSKIFQ